MMEVNTVMLAFTTIEIRITYIIFNFTDRIENDYRIHIIIASACIIVVHIYLGSKVVPTRVLDAWYTLISLLRTELRERTLMIFDASTENYMDLKLAAHMNKILFNEK